MRAWAKADADAGGARRRGGWALIAAVWLGLAPTVAAAGFEVGSVESRAVGRTLHVSGQLELGVTPKVEEAIDTGIPIELAIDFRLYRRRPLLWDERVDGWTVRRALRYHALSGQYLVTGGATAPVERESANSLDEALAEMGSLDDLTLPLAAPLAAGAAYRIDVRVALDVEALPSLLRPLAYTSPAWSLNSGWTTWKVTH